MTTVAYPLRPQPPGWAQAILSLLIGWALGAAGTVVLYAAAVFVGAMGRPYGAHAGSLNEWPYADNGVWSECANLAVILIGLVVTTLATSWWLRRKHSPVSDGRLAVTLLFTGWIPLATAGPVGGFFGFLVALLLVRYWVARHDDTLTIRSAAVIVGLLAVVAVPYGLLHPLWTSDVVPRGPAGQNREVTVVVHNAARVAVTVDQLKAAPVFEQGVRPGRLHIASNADGLFVLSVPRGGCGTARIGIRARYHLFGLTLSQTVPVHVALGRPC